MKTKLTLFITVFATFLLGVGCGSTGKIVHPIINPGASGGYVYSLAPWTQGKPNSERYQIFWRDREIKPFTGTAVSYAFNPGGSGIHPVLQRIEIYKDGDLFELTFYSAKKQAKLIPGRFKNVKGEDFPEKEYDSYKRAQIVYSRIHTREERHHVIDLKEWNADGKLFLHAKDGVGAGAEAVGTYGETPFDENGHPNTNSNYGDFSSIKLWNADGSIRVKR